MTKPPAAAQAALKMIKRASVQENAPATGKLTKEQIIDGASTVSNPKQAPSRGKGRRRRGPGPLRVQFNVKLPYTLVQQIDEVVTRNKHTVQGFVEMVLGEYCARVLSEQPRRGRPPGSKNKVDEGSQE
jgi:hypothetical protein